VFCDVCTAAMVNKLAPRAFRTREDRHTGQGQESEKSADHYL
jgi:hypothetical protein